MELEEDLSIDISGRNALNGLPKDVKIYSSEIVEALGELLQQIIEEIKVILEKHHLNYHQILREEESM